ncbi:MAG: hypothetical protein KJ697_01610 [Nanoarchaeota archaeon]|nr:hypothetical protein [Nanoarchaeota archaeon]
MKSTIFMDGEKFTETDFGREEDFENLVIEKSKLLFGSNTIYFNLKNKIKSQFLGNSIPDGFLFDFKDKENPEFYIVEVELAKHDFYKHIFPQITKFFAFFKNPKSRNELVETLHQYIQLNAKLEQEFKSYLGKGELYKALKEIIENSQHILIVIDENKSEFQEIMETYTDTWDKMVKIEILKQYTANEKTIFTLNPDFEEIELVEPLAREESEEKYTENFHLDDISEDTQNLYKMIKEEILKLGSNIRINPQKYYISLRDKKNFAYLDMKKKKINISIMLPYEIGQGMIKYHKLRQYTEGIQKFYGSSSFQIIVENKDNIDEVLKLLAEAYKQQNK